MKRYSKTRQRRTHHIAPKYWAVQLGAHIHSAISEHPGRHEGLGHRPFKRLGSLIGVGRCCVNYY